MKTTVGSRLVQKLRSLKRSDLEKLSYDVPAGPPVRLKGPNRPVALCLLLLALTGLIVKNFVSENYYIPEYPILNALLNFEITSTSGVATLLAGTLAAFVVRRQLIINLRPIVLFSAGPNAPSALEKRPSTQYWNVSISNFGLGPAIVQGALYRVSTTSDAGHFAEFQEVWPKIATMLREYEDYVLYRYAEGAAISSGKSIPLLECDVEKAKLYISNIEMILLYRSIMGELYAKRIKCFPDYLKKSSKDNGKYYSPNPGEGKGSRPEQGFLKS